MYQPNEFLPYNDYGPANQMNVTPYDQNDVLGDVLPQIDELCASVNAISNGPKDDKNDDQKIEIPSTQGRQKRFRTAFTSKQISALEKAFAVERYISAAKRHEMSLEIDMPERQIKIWFQNRRMKSKNQHKRRGNQAASSEASETSSVMSGSSNNTVSTSNTSKRDSYVPNAYPFENVTTNVDNYVEQNIQSADANFDVYFGMNHYDPFLDQYGYNFGTSFDNIFNNYGNQGNYGNYGNATSMNQSEPPPMANGGNYGHPMNSAYNSKRANQYVGPFFPNLDFNQGN